MCKNEERNSFSEFRELIKDFCIFFLFRFRNKFNLENSGFCVDDEFVEST